MVHRGWFIEKKSITETQRNYRSLYQRDLPSRNVSCAEKRRKDYSRNCRCGGRHTCRYLKRNQLSAWYSPYDEPRHTWKFIDKGHKTFWAYLTICAINLNLLQLFYDVLSIKKYSVFYRNPAYLFYKYTIPKNGVLKIYVVPKFSNALIL